MSRTEELVKELTQASEDYYSQGLSSLSDAEFDAKRMELKKLDPDNPFFRAVGAPVAGGALSEVEHLVTMGSLDNLFDKKDFADWKRRQFKNDDNVPMVMQWKLDGISIELQYRDGAFDKAVTRGDGRVGEDVTHSVGLASGYPKTIPLKGDVSVRSEAVLPISTWRQHFSDMANPRNAVAGLLRRKEGDSGKHIRIVSYGLEPYSGTTEFHRVQALKEMGFQTVKCQLAFASQVTFFVAEWAAEREYLEFLVDGIVIKADDISLQQELGEKDNRPKWGRAWKFPAASAHSTLRTVRWQVGTAGVITPVAEIEPVKLCGVTVSNVSLHNMDQVERLGVCIGDKVEVCRAGDVIPHMVRKVSGNEHSQPITCSECPACKSPVERRGPFYFCMGESCEGAEFRRLFKYVKKRDILGLGKSILQSMYASGDATSPLHLYKMNLSTLQKHAGNANGPKVMEEINRSRESSLSDLVGSLSIDMLGRREAANLVEKGIDTLDKFLSLTEEQLLGLEGYAEVKAARIVASIRKNIDLIQAMAKQVTVQEVKKSSGGILSGKSFCFTGASSKPRKELHVMVESAGGEIKTSVSKGLTYLVSADENTSKSEKAKKLGVQVITEQQFYQMLEAK